MVFNNELRIGSKFERKIWKIIQYLRESLIKKFFERFEETCSLKKHLDAWNGL